MVKLAALGLAAGLAATPHCLGMCGCFPLHLARSSGPRDLLARQVLYVLGKAFTYVFLGAVVGFVGEVLVRSEWAIGSRKLLAGAAGAVMIVCGLQMLGLRLRLSARWLNVQDWGPVTQLYDCFFRTPGLWAAFMLGLLTGFLPCPVTAAMLVAAAATQSVVAGMIVMGAVAIGTAPVLLAVGLSGGLLSARFKAVGLRAAGVVLIVLGAATV
ncbi:MAG: sulfite exporter TauE/SafE family protein, partial [Armatimonadota bacterium]